MSVLLHWSFCLTVHTSSQLKAGFYKFAYFENQQAMRPTHTMCLVAKACVVSCYFNSLSLVLGSGNSSLNVYLSCH